MDARKTRLALTLLGDFQARLGSGPVLRLRTRKTQALLAYLASPPGRSHSRDKLAALLWGERSQHQARGRLRETLFVLRRALTATDPPCLDLGSEAVALNADAVDVDVASFERLLKSGDPHGREEAVRLYRGDFLQGIAFRGAPFEDWLMAERERLHELAVDALAKVLANQRASGSADAALQTALRLIALDPLQEAVHRTLMRLYTEQGRRGAALRQYQVCVGVLQRELGVEPEADTRRLYQEILRQRPRGEPDGKTAPHTSAPAALAPSPMIGGSTTPLIGRAHEMTRLRELIVQARAGHGHVAAVVGEAGIGKSRLVAEVAGEALAAGAHLLVGRCYESDQILPLGPWVEACRSAELIRDARLLADLRPVWRAELTRLLPELDAAGLPSPSGSDLRLFESIAYLVEQLAARRPLVIVLEDLHWADEMSVRLLRFISRRSSGWRALLLVTAQEEELADAPAARWGMLELSSESHAVVMPLAPLTPAETLRLIQSLRRGGPDAEAIAGLEQQVWTASEGNPFVVLETVRAIEEGAVLPNAAMPLSQRVRELVAARLERLSDPARQAAAVAAVIGRQFDFALLMKAAQLDEAIAAAGVEELVRRRVLQEAGERLEFTHDRTRAVAYSQLFLPWRRMLHQRVGESIEALHSGNLEPHYLALGIHYREAEAWAKAVQYLRQAGIGALARSAYREAIASFQEALAALKHLPGGRDQIQAAADLHLHMREALNPLGEIEAILEHLRRAEALAQALGDQRRLAGVLCNLTQYFRQVGDHRQGRQCAEQALAVAETLEDFGLLVTAIEYLAQITWAQGDAATAKRLFERFVDSFQGEDVRNRFGMTGYPAVAYRVLLGACHADLGEFRQAIDRGEQGFTLAQEIGQPYMLVIACLWLGRIYLLRGDVARAEGLLRRGLNTAESRHIGGWGHYASSASLGYALALSGRVAEALPLLKRAEEDAKASRTFGRLALFVAWLGEAHLLAGQVDDADAAARRALGLSRDHQERGHEAWSLRLLGEIAAHRDPDAAIDAERCYQDALGLAEQLGMRPLMARCHVGLSLLCRRGRQDLLARTHLRTAAGMLRSMGMNLWLARVEAELRALV
jgi:DNA-binding SARP family transcriptional activator